MVWVSKIKINFIYYNIGWKAVQERILGHTFLFTEYYILSKIYQS